MTRRYVITAALIAGALSLAACSGSTSGGKGSAASNPGGSSGAASSTPASSTPASSTATSSAPASTAPTGGSSASGTARIAGIPVRAGDLPAGWTPGKGDNSTPAQDAAQKAELARCTGVKASAAGNGGRVDSDFTQGDNDISSNAQVVTSAQLQADVALLRSPKIERCYEQTARRMIAGSLPSGTSVTSVHVTITPSANGAPSNVVALGNAVVHVVAGGNSADVFVDFAYVKGPGVEAEVDFTGVGARIPSALESKLVTAVAQRAAKA
jgi:hypothetical protein